MKKLIVISAIGALVWIASTSKAKEQAKKPVIITDHDRAYDYKYEGNRWYTKRKGATDWIDMKNALLPVNYTLAISRLTDYANRNGIVL